MTQHELIKAVGGAKRLAEMLRLRGVSVADVTVRSWTLSGRTIPAKYWSHVVALANEAGVIVSFETLAAQVAAPPHCPLCETSTPGEIAACTCVDCPNRQKEAA